MEILLLFSVVCVVLYFVVRIIFSIVFTKLTAHWVSIAVTMSYVIGAMIGQIAGQFGTLHHDGDVLRAIGIMVLSTLIALNFAALPALYGWDKRLSRSTGENTTRVPENALHALTGLGGAVGSMIGQHVFKHKRSKASYQSKHRWMLVASVFLYAVLAYVLIA
ncbi:MAG: DUF1294 domain-containing protein [Paracoccaceae bacterium]